MNNQQNKNTNGLDIDPSELIGRHFGITKKHENMKTQKHRNKKTRKHEKDIKRNKEIKEINKDPYEDLVTRLEGKLNGKSFEGLIDFRDEQEKQEDIIDELQKKLLPKQDIDASEALEPPEDLELPMENNTQDTINNKQEKDKIKREIRNKKLEIKEKKKLEKTQLKEEQLRIKTLEKIKIKKESEKLTNQKINYISIIKFPVIFLVGIELLIYIFSLNAILPLIILLNIIVFILLAIKALKRYNYNQWLVVKICLLAGIIVGLFRAIFIMIWVGESWTIINIIAEPVILGVVAVIMSLVARLFVFKHANNDACPQCLA